MNGKYWKTKGAMRTAATLGAVLLLGFLPLAALPSGMADDDLLPAELTLAGPANGDPGDVLEFEGQLTLQGVGIPLQEVEILRDGEPVATATTGVDGSYVFELDFPDLGTFELVAMASGSSLLHATSPPHDVHIWSDLPLGAVSIAAGERHSCVAFEDGVVYCWGANDRGQLGDGTNTDRVIATPVSGISNAVSLSAGFHSTCALLINGTVSCWGGNEFGQLGDGTTTDRNTPVLVLNLSHVLDLGAGQALHTCAIVTHGNAYCWGWNPNGQLGDGTTTDRSSAVAVADLTSVESIAAGVSHTCASVTNGTVYCWGNNIRGQLGDGTTTARMEPTPVINVEDGTAVGAGYQYSCAITADNSLYCWGSNNAGQVGNGRTRSAELPGLSGLADVATVTLGFAHTCASTGDGSPYCWGENTFGQLGDDTNTARSSAVAVAQLASVESIAAGASHTCAAVTNGTVYCWGRNSEGQLGDGTTTQRLTPVAVQGTVE